MCRPFIAAIPLLNLFDIAKIIIASVMVYNKRPIAIIFSIVHGTNFIKSKLSILYHRSDNPIFQVIGFIVIKLFDHGVLDVLFNAIAKDYIIVPVVIFSPGVNLTWGCASESVKYNAIGIVRHIFVLRFVTML
nr:MAG TPA: hypothetical protein [Caudoviricetes sp.]